MAKKKAEKIRHEPTKRQLSKFQQAERRRRLILYAGLLVLVAVLVVLGFGVYNGWYTEDYKPLHETVIEVNGVKFNMGYYIDTLTYYYGMGMSQEDLFDNADNVVESIQRNEVMRQEAEKLGYFITDDDILLAFEGANVHMEKKYWGPIRAELLAELLMTEYFDNQVPTQAEQRHILAMFLESEEKVSEVKARLDAGEDFIELAGELSLDSIAKEKSGDFDWRPEGALTQLLGTPAVDDFAFSAAEGEVSAALADTETGKQTGYWLVKVMDRNDDGMPHIHPILVSSKEEAEAIKARAEAGEDYDTLQGEYSLDQTMRCLYYPEEADINEAVAGYAFDPDTEVGVISDPIRDDTMTTPSGYWLVKVVGIESGQDISAEDRGYLKLTVLNDWADDLLADPDNEIISYLDEEKQGWALMKVFYG